MKEKGKALWLFTVALWLFTVSLCGSRIHTDWPLIVPYRQKLNLIFLWILGVSQTSFEFWKLFERKFSNFFVNWVCKQAYQSNKFKFPRLYPEVFKSWTLALQFLSLGSLAFVSLVFEDFCFVFLINLM